MPHYMLDTDISSYVMGRTSSVVLRRFENTPASDLCISVVTKAELMFGMLIHPRRGQAQLSLDDYLKYVDVLDLPSGAANDYAEIRADLRSRGTIIGANDLMIAAHARFLGLILVTNNTREFQRVQGLQIENWAQPAV